MYSIGMKTLVEIQERMERLNKTMEEYCKSDEERRIYNTAIKELQWVLRDGDD